MRNSNSPPSRTCLPVDDSGMRYSEAHVRANRQAERLIRVSITPVDAGEGSHWPRC